MWQDGVKRERGSGGEGGSPLPRIPGQRIGAQEVPRGAQEAPSDPRSGQKAPKSHPKGTHGHPRSQKREPRVPNGVVLGLYEAGSRELRRLRLAHLEGWGVEGSGTTKNANQSFDFAAARPFQTKISNNQQQ